jgi:hypothetical protein
MILNISADIPSCICLFVNGVEMRSLTRLVLCRAYFNEFGLGHIVKYQIISYRIVSYRTVPYRVVSCRIVSGGLIELW